MAEQQKKRTMED
ncbi:hypothetical protein RDI58_021788 [Solanum bulbocastanum]|uniref:Uncharacterized protein n=1 Tax=Solanum bulbocastanum TaxID=147425 RepID=A0AAN8Y527_SOLBU